MDTNKDTKKNGAIKNSERQPQESTSTLDLAAQVRQDMADQAPHIAVAVVIESDRVRVVVSDPNADMLVVRRIIGGGRPNVRCEWARTVSWPGLAGDPVHASHGAR